MASKLVTALTKLASKNNKRSGEERVKALTFSLIKSAEGLEDDEKKFEEKRIAKDNEKQQRKDENPFEERDNRFANQSAETDKTIKSLNNEYDEKERKRKYKKTIDGLKSDDTPKTENKSSDTDKPPASPTTNPPPAPTKKSLADRLKSMLDNKGVQYGAGATTGAVAGGVIGSKVGDPKNKTRNTLIGTAVGAGAGVAGTAAIRNKDKIKGLIQKLVSPAGNANGGGINGRLDATQKN